MHGASGTVAQVGVGAGAGAHSQVPAMAAAAEHGSGSAPPASTGVAPTPRATAIVDVSANPPEADVHGLLMTGCVLARPEEPRRTPDPCMPRPRRRPICGRPMMEILMTLKTRVAAVGGTLTLALTLAACGGSSEGTDPTVAPEGTTGTSQATATVDAAQDDADTEFAQMMIVHHEGAIEMADVAATDAASEEVRELAENISAAQGPEIDKMSSWLEAWGEEPTAEGDMGGMDMGGLDQEAAMAELSGVPGADFDRRFRELMIEHHRGAVDMAEAELAGGENPQALELAQRIIDAQTTEIAEMEQMLQAL